VAALVLVVLVGAWLNRKGEPSAPAASTGAASPSTLRGDFSSTPSPPSRPKIAAIGSVRRVGDTRQSRTVGRVPFSFSVPSGGWYRFGELSISKSTVGPQSAEAIIFWTNVGRSGYAVACGQWWGDPTGSVEKWAAEASSKRGTELVKGPVDATVGGYPAQHVVFTVRRENVACGPGFFHRWKAKNRGPFWSGIEGGDTVRIWLVDVGGRILFIEGDTHAGASRHVEQEIGRIVASVVIE
jgi:hypothetical protein